ncbi:MAG: RNA polymerase sigma factor [Prevotella sp.]|nr:RNA polymerase sigma factor [Prevotella sp.]
MKIIDFRHELLPLKDKMFRLALRITLNRAEAEDVTQDILLRVWEQRESLGELRSLEAYVLTAVRNLALDRVAKTDNANVSLDDVQTAAFDSAPRPDEDMEQQESLKRVREIMSGLPEAQRTALQLREIEGHSYRETADIMNVSEANVKVLIFRARQAVKNKIDKIENYGL